MTSDKQQKNPIQLIERQTRLLEQIYREQHEFFESSLAKGNKEFSLSKHAGAGAIFAAFVATLWVVHYLITTEFGFSAAAFGGEGVIGSSLLDYVTGQVHNMETFGTEATFIILSRFIVAFGFSWPPITLVIAIIRKFI